jgi:hypothetical protein
VDGDIATRLDHALDATAGDLFLVVVALFVAVVDPRHRRVAPVDDLHVGLPIDEAALPDHHVLAVTVLLEAHVREVRGADVDRQRHAATEPRGERREARHLLDQGREILRARFGDLIAERDEVRIEVAGPDLGPLVLVPHGHPGLDLAEKPLLVRDDARAGTAFFDLVTHGERANLSKLRRAATLRAT